MKLLALCAAADNREAFSRLVAAYEDNLRRFLLNLCGGNVSLVDDLAQETFIKAWLGIRAFKGLSGFKTWLFRIAVNEFVSYRRKQFPEPLTDSSYGHSEMRCASTHVQIENKMDISIALSYLSEDERIVVLLFYLEDLPIKKICNITGMPEGTVKSHLSRGRAHLIHFFKNN